MTRARDLPIWAGLGVVGAAAAIASFTALADFARLCGITALAWGWLPIAWLLPLTIDVLAAVASLVWLQRRASDDAVQYARRAAWCAIVATVAANGAHGWLAWSGSSPAWWVAVLVAAVPPVALGAMVHLAVLVGRSPDQPAVEGSAGDAWLQLLDDVLAEPWERPVMAWSAGVDVAARRPPSRDEGDDELASDLRWVTSRLRRLLTRAEVAERYGIGSTRAKTVRDLVDAGETPDREPESVP